MRGFLKCLTAWLETYQSLAIWLEGVALVAIFFLDWRERKDQRKERQKQHEETAAQFVISQKQVEAAIKSAEDTHDLAQQAIRQTDLTQAQLELSHRPWVSADIGISSNLIFDQRGAVLMLNVTMRNLGSSVAKHVSLWTELVVSGVHDLNQAHERLCNIMKQPVNEKSDYGSLLFPGQVVIEPRPVIANQQDIDQALKSGHFKDVGAVGLHLIGCVDYQSSFDAKKHHQTKFVLLVGRIDRQKGIIMGTFEPQNKSYDGIVVTPTMHGASAD